MVVCDKALFLRSPPVLFEKRFQKSVQGILCKERDMCLCRNETALFCRNDIRFAVVVRDYTVFNDDSSGVISKAFLEFPKMP